MDSLGSIILPTTYGLFCLVLMAIGCQAFIYLLMLNALLEKEKGEQLTHLQPDHI